MASPAPSALVGIRALVLIVHLCAERRSYTVTFAPGADIAAAAFILARTSYCAIGPADDVEGDPHNPLSGWPQAEAALYPECEHGLSLSLCCGPNHYPSDEDMEMGRF